MLVKDEESEVLRAAIEVMGGERDEGAMSLYHTEDGGVYRTDPDVPDIEMQKTGRGEEIPLDASVIWTATRKEIEDELDRR